jgi:beta-lactamase class D
MFFTLHGCSTNWKESSEVNELFINADKFSGHNQARSTTRFVPASTFKIPNSLIGLSVEAVRNVDDVLPFGGKPQPFDAWEKDMGLREAITLSNVPTYQELARRIGLEKMRENITRLD